MISTRCVMSAFDALDAIPLDVFLGWCAVVLVIIAVATHFAEWRRT